MKIKLLSVVCVLLMWHAASAQTILYTENFEGTYPGWQLNTPDLSGDNSLSDNQWTVNNAYASGFSGFFTNTPDEPSGIPNYPESNYLHIYSEQANQIDGTINDVFDASGNNSYFAMDSVLHTTGHTGVSLSFWWICQGNANTAVGEVYYRTSAAGSWNILNNPASGLPKFNQHGSGWIQAVITDTAFDNKPYLQFGFRFRHASSGSDPAFGVDDVVVSATGTISPKPVASFTVSPTHGCPGDCVVFTSTSSGSVSSLQWSFSGGNPSSSSSSPVTVCYALAGTYAAQLIAIGPGGSDTLLNSHADTIHAAPNVPLLNQDNTVMYSNAPSGLSYQWYLNGSSISGATADSFNAGNNNGFYQLQVTNSFGCSSLSDSFHYIKPSGVSLLGGDPGIRFYPNPAHDLLFFEQENANALEINVCDLSGRILIRRVENNKSFTLPMLALPAGMYLLQLRNDTMVRTQKIVKE